MQESLLDYLSLKTLPCCHSGHFPKQQCTLGWRHLRQQLQLVSASAQPYPASCRKAVGRERAKSNELFHCFWPCVDFLPQRYVRLFEACRCQQNTALDYKKELRPIYGCSDNQRQRVRTNCCLRNPQVESVNWQEQLRAFLQLSIQCVKCTFLEQSRFKISSRFWWKWNIHLFKNERSYVCEGQKKKHLWQKWVCGFCRWIIFMN